MWSLNDYIYKRRRDIDKRYDYRYSVLIFVFSRLIKQKWISLDDLEGLDREKLEQIELLVDNM